MESEEAPQGQVSEDTVCQAGLEPREQHPEKQAEAGAGRNSRVSRGDMCDAPAADHRNSASRPAPRCWESGPWATRMGMRGPDEAGAPAGAGSPRGRGPATWQPSPLASPCPLGAPQTSTSAWPTTGAATTSAATPWAASSAAAGRATSC